MSVTAATSECLLWTKQSSETLEVTVKIKETIWLTFMYGYIMLPFLFQVIYEY